MIDPPPSLVLLPPIFDPLEMFNLSTIIIFHNYNVLTYLDTTLAFPLHVFVTLLPYMYAILNV